MEGSQLSKIEREIGSLAESSRRSERQYEKLVKSLEKFAEVIPELVLNAKRLNTTDAKVSLVRDDMFEMKTRLAIIEEKQSKSDKIVYGVITLIVSGVGVGLLELVLNKGGN